jgi:hypothetical protein
MDNFGFAYTFSYWKNSFEIEVHVKKQSHKRQNTILHQAVILNKIQYCSVVAFQYYSVFRGTMRSTNCY